MGRGYDADYLVIGSGFGGSVSAHRLAEKGYRVIVLEAGKRWKTGDFPKTNWNVRKYLWAPVLRCFGIQRLTLLKDVLILSGAGVGGGSLVYANTLLVPPRKFFTDSKWAHLDNWEEKLAPFYERAKQMLGATPSHFLGVGDNTLKAVADEMGQGHTFHQPTVAVYFGEPGKTQDDPFFEGKGPARTGCTYCGGCMVGCRVGAKNTLDKNYLYLAERAGAQVLPETTVDDVHVNPAGGYEVHTYQTTGWPWNRGRRMYRAKNVVFAGGVLGTVNLLMKCAESGSLANLSRHLGNFLRTNSEAIVGAMARARGTDDHSRGIAITSGFYPDENTHIEIVRYGAGQDAMGRIATLMVDGGQGQLARIGGWLKTAATHPMDLLRTLWPFGWARATAILLVMQTVDNHMRLVRKRGLFGKRLSTELAPGIEKPPTYIPVANLVARKMAAKIDGVSVGALNEAFLDVPTTAHILGGCPMGASAEEGVIGPNHEIHNYPGLFVCDGSAISANLGVNPSLTICAMTELAMSRIADNASANAHT